MVQMAHTNTLTDSDSISSNTTTDTYSTCVRVFI